MPLEYRKPPLVEALCELRFASAPDRKWDWAIPGMLYDLLRERFPIRKEHHSIDISLVGPAATGPVVHPIERLQFVSRDETSLIQVGRDLLAVNSIRPHLGWQDLRATVFEVLRDYREIASPQGLIMAAVRYINRVELPVTPGFSLEQYFAVLPGLPEGVPRAVSKFLLHTEVGYSDPPALLRFRFGTTDSQDRLAAFMLDYEHVAAAPVAPTFEGLGAWLDSGHSRIEQAFYGSFTPMTHVEIFEENRS